MKPINEMTIQECLEEFFEQRQLELYAFGSTWRQVLVDRIHELTRWIPVEERLPSLQDGEPFMGRVLWMWGVGYVEAKSWNNMPPKATHWRRIDKP